jgi:hypothetical protein
MRKFSITDLLKRVRNFIIVSTESQSKFYNGIVLTCGFILAIGLCLTLRPKFEYQYVGDIVSWITTNKYPKQQDTYYYILSLVLIPSISIITWLLWLLWSSIASILAKLPSHHALKKYALTHLVFILILMNISTPTFKKMLMIPLILFASVNMIFFVYDLTRTRLKKLTRLIFESSDQHWCVLASGVSVGLFVLINYGENPIKILSCLKYIALSSLFIWLFWLIYSLILRLITKRSFVDVKSVDVYSYIPLVLLLLVSLLYEHGVPLLIISITCAFIIKILSIIKPEYIQRFSSKKSQKWFLDYILVPAIIYAIFYSGGNISGGIDLFHEGERIAPLNDALRGAIPYKDVYLQHGLFYNFYRPLLASKLFGVSLASDRLLGSILDPLGHVGFYLFALQIFKSKLSAFLLLWIMSSGVSEEFVYWNASRRMVYTPGRIAPAYFSLAVMAFYLNRIYNRIEGFKSPLIPLSKGGNSKLSLEKWYKGGFSSLAQFFGYKKLYLPFFAGILSCLAVFNSLEIGLYVTTASVLFLTLFMTYPQSIPQRIVKSGSLGFHGEKTVRAKRLHIGNILHQAYSNVNASPLLTYLVGLLIVFIPVSIYLALHGAFNDMIRNSYIQTHYQGTIWGFRFPPLFPELAKIKSIESIKAFIISETFKWYLPILIYLITATYLAYQVMRCRLWKAQSNIKLLLLLISGIVFFRTMLGRSDSAHLYGMAFAWMIGMFLIETLFIKIWKELKTDFRLSVSWHSHNPISTLSHPISVIAWRGIVIIIFFWYATAVYNPIDTAKNLSAIISGYGQVQRYVDPTIERVGKMIIPADQANQIKAVVDYIQKNTSPDEAIFDFSNEGGYYFFADRPSATRYHQICYASLDSLQIEVIESLESHKTKLVIFSNSSWMDTIDGVPNANRHKLIANYLKEKYTEATKIGTTVIYKRVKG